MGKDKLTEKQEQFCHEYVVDFNAKQAAIRSGYSKRTAESMGSRLLSNAKVAKRIEELKVPRRNAPKDLRERILLELETIAFTNPDEFFEEVEVIDEETGQVRYVQRQIKAKILDSPNIGAISSFEPGAYGTKIKMNDKKGALEMLARHVGLFNADTSQKPETNQFDFTNISSDKLRKIKEILSDDSES